MLISVILLVKNGEAYLRYLDRQFQILENDGKHTFTFYIYENNSNDDTKILLKEFMKSRKGLCISENIDKPKSLQGISNERGEHMANLRNNLKDKHGRLDSEYTILLDTDVVFHTETIDYMIESFNNNDDVAMVTPFSICWHSLLLGHGIHYYDSLALENSNGIGYRQSGNTCLFSYCKRCIFYRNKFNIQLDRSELIDFNDTTRVNSAFGGFCMIKTSVYNKVKWYNSICEHFSFCKDVLKYGDILINQKARTVTTIPEFSNDDHFQKIVSFLQPYYV